MSEPERRICRYYNTLGGCWYGDKCKFLHVANKKPPCKFFVSSTGCRFGENCHFSHERTPFKSVENYEDGSEENIKEEFKENMDPSELSGTNNNNMEQPSANSNASANANANTNANVNTNANTNTSNVGSTNHSATKETKEIDVQCGSCKRILERQGQESYCNILKDHYLECFLEKEGDHIKLVKFKAALDPGQMYWCKTCILIFEKPWSLFQHMADKARGVKVQRWDKKVHLDWLETIAGLMAGYDLGLFSPGKLRLELRNLLADHHVMEEEMEAAAMTAAALMQWFAPGGGAVAPAIANSSWSLQKRDIIRKMEQMNRQVFRGGSGGRGGGGPLGIGGGGGNRGYQQSSGLAALSGGGGRGRYMEAITAGANHVFSDHQSHLHDLATNPASLPHQSQPVDSHDSPATGGSVEKDTPAAVSGGFNGGGDRPASATAAPTPVFKAATAPVGHKRPAEMSGGGGGNSSDLNCGFTDAEVEELEAQGIKPWDEEAGAALAALHGDLDYLLE